LSQLIGGKHFTLLCTLASNGYGVKTSALIDSRANGLVFIDSQYATDIAEFLDLPFIRLRNPCLVKGFNGQAGKAVTYMIVLNLGIDGRRQNQVLMLILDLGNHDIILGWKWIAESDV
jgi:hypothetical protein